jgi:hypothetical protein
MPSPLLPKRLSFRINDWLTETAHTHLKEILAVALCLIFAALSILTLLLGCSGPSVEIKDVTVYGSLGSSGAAVVHTLSQATGQISDAQWRMLWYNPGHAPGPMLCMTASDFAEIKREQELLCSYYGNCSDEVINTANSFSVRVKKAVKF